MIENELRELQWINLNPEEEQNAEMGVIYLNRRYMNPNKSKWFNIDPDDWVLLPPTPYWTQSCQHFIMTALGEWTVLTLDKVKLG